MIKDPYEVLGVSRGATDEEITAAYRALAKQHHPDLHPGDPKAAARMQEINEAYQRLRDGTADIHDDDLHGGAQNAGGPFAGFGGHWTAERESPWEEDFAAVREALQEGRFLEAQFLLSAIPERGAEWYFLGALAYSGLGDRAMAISYARMAAETDPGDDRYRMLYERLTGQGRAYAARSTEYGGWFRASRVRMFCLWYCIFHILASICCRSVMTPGGGIGTPMGPRV